ncbi:uncharacterized protein Z518_00350 [Rhinocladiella mackenziei CBS 650.93]|uniref:Uncharacterized protein n=1 Tax=Rhinocladiella mackenziei CBS 650.93 TaxID=1442369 RepID=A0A0D2J0Q7_9EURO|nr:uncharacterized protein Z518_00350 [Rhinocladiella mackenziei CBS 650.93]KIX09271.1 hypothetical protein Z518_00350 [Rhinocladiella mackenziei CBS 650.93]
MRNRRQAQDLIRDRTKIYVSMADDGHQVSRYNRGDLTSAERIIVLKPDRLNGLDRHPMLFSNVSYNTTLKGIWVNERSPNICTGVQLENGHDAGHELDRKSRNVQIVIWGRCEGAAMASGLNRSLEQHLLTDVISKLAPDR